MGLFSKLFGKKDDTDYAQLVKEGAIVLDVRSKSEFAGGHIRGALNIPVAELGTNLGQLKDKNRVIITCCASGIRSAAAKNTLNTKGYPNVYNGGGWKSLEDKLAH
jgi:rhodanese-related sulfurtransferase